MGPPPGMGEVVVIGGGYEELCVGRIRIKEKD
jgi:hypothetical protein